MTSLPTLLLAIDFAAVRHSAQRRKGPSGAPYVNHLIEVATLLATYARVTDVEVLAAAVLHDVLEDTPTAPHEVEARFGKRVLALVEAVSDDKNLSREAQRQHVLDHLAAAEADVKLIKLADLCSNAASLPLDWSRARKREYLDWSARAAALCRGTCPALDELYEQRAAAVRVSSGAYD